MKALQTVFGFLRGVAEFLAFLFVLLLFLLIVQRSAPEPQNAWDRISYMSSDYSFDIVRWELEAIMEKIDDALFGFHPFMTEEDRSQFVLDYLDDLKEAQSLEATVNSYYSSPYIDDPAVETAEMQAERDALRISLEERQGMAESILESQVASVLLEEGFGTLNQIFPPVTMRFSEQTNVLVISPRSVISYSAGYNLGGMTTEDMVALETQVENEFEWASTAVLPLGGIALYPALILESSSIKRVTEVFAHEWLHHYLVTTLSPLGIQYFASTSGLSSEARTINESTATLFGKEVGRIVMERYYPQIEYDPPIPENVTEAPPFNFNRELFETRSNVDQMLVEGRFEDAEAYMEERRLLFLDKWYNIRRMNQAYFAFYGGYQGSSVSAGGIDPTGPAIQDIRDMSPTIYDFIQTMLQISTKDELLAMRDEMAESVTSDGD